MKRTSLLFLFVLAFCSLAFLVRAEEAAPTKQPAPKDKTPAAVMNQAAPFLFPVSPGFAGATDMVRIRIVGADVQGIFGSAPGAGHNGVLVAPDLLMFPFIPHPVHVLVAGEGGPRWKVKVPGGEEYGAKMLGRYSKLGVAFLKLDRPVDNPRLLGDLPSAPEPSLGDPVLLVCRRGKEWKYAPFFLPAVVNGELRDGDLVAWSLNLPSSQLSSEALGALVLDLKGRAIGLVQNLPEKRYSTVLLSLDTLADAVDTAVDDPDALDPVNPVVEARGGIEVEVPPDADRPERPKPSAFLGVSVAPLSEEEARKLGLAEPTGVVVERVGKDSPAEKAGLKKGDVILEADGVVIDEPRRLKDVIASHMPGDVIEILLLRDGKETTVEVTLEKR